MYKILIVDDERTERECICYLIESFDLHLDIRTAENAQDALELLKSWPADILFTDIRMPGTSGLELAKEASRLLPEIKTAIFSSFAEFEYARTAMTLGVASYILKPVVPAELKTTLKNILRELDDVHSTRLQHNTQQSFLLQHALQGCINGTIPSEISSEMLDLLSEFHHVILLDLSPHFLEKNYASFYEELHREMQLDMETLNLSSSQSLLFLRRKFKDAYSFGCRLHAYITKNFQTECYISISRPVNGYSDLQSAFAFTEQQMEQRFWNPETKVFSYDCSSQAGDSHKEPDDNFLLGMIKRSLYDKDDAGLTQNLNTLFQKYRSSSNQSQIYVKFIFSNLITTLYPFLPDKDSGKAGSARNLDILISELYIQQDILKIIGTIQAMAQKIIESYSTSPAEGMRKEVLSTQNYILEHYDCDLSVEMLASLVYLTPDYLSRLFKKSTGKSLSQYIRQVRMEKASSLLLTTSRKVIDIGASVGYSNYSYFCQSFREYFGKSPEKYRQEESL